MYQSNCFSKNCIIYEFVWGFSISLTWNSKFCKFNVKSNLLLRTSSVFMNCLSTLTLICTCVYLSQFMGLSQLAFRSREWYFFYLKGVKPRIIYIRMAKWSRLMLSRHAIQTYGHHIGSVIMSDDRESIMAKYHDFTISFTSTIFDITNKNIGQFSKLFWLHF